MKITMTLEKSRAPSGNEFHKGLMMNERDGLLVSQAALKPLIITKPSPAI